MVARRKSAADTYNMGDTVDLGGPSHYVRLPDGAVVTARSTFTFRQTGEHVVTSGDGAEPRVYDVPGETNNN